MKALIELLMKMGKTKEEALEIIGKDLPTGGIDNVSSNILKPITKKVVGDYPLVGSRITDPTSVKNFDLKSVSESIADQEKNWKKTFEFLSEGGYNLSALQKQNLTYNLGILKRSKDTAKNLSSERFDALGKYLEKRDTLFGPEKADVFDLTGKKIDTSKPILGGKNVPESGPEVSGIREPKDFANIVGMRPTDETLNKLVEEHQNNLRLINQTDAEGGTAISYEKFNALQKRNEEIEKTLKNARKVADEEDAASAIGKVNKNRPMTADELEDFEMGIGNDNLEAYNFDGTVDDGARILKEEADYRSAMFAQYKMGKLDPVAGDKSQARKRFLEKKLEDAEMSGDNRLITRDEMDELESFDFSVDDMKLSTNDEIKKGVDEIMSDTSPAALEKSIEIDNLMLKYEGMDRPLAETIATELNPRKKADIIAMVEQTIKMSEEGKSGSEIIDIFKKTPRTEQSKGGRIKMAKGGLPNILGF